MVTILPSQSLWRNRIAGGCGYSGPGIAGAKQLSGKELSYNNLMDLDAALAIVRVFGEPAAAVI